MCNRFSSTKNKARLELRKSAIAIANLFTRYNIAPQTKAPVVSRADDKLFSRDWIPSGVPTGALRSYRVSSAVSTPGLETPECIAPLVGVPEQSELW